MDGLMSNIIEVIKEEQIKLGYQKENIRLYYPLSSLNTLLGTKLRCASMKEQLDEFFQQKADILGAVEVTYRAERFCINLPEQATEYVHKHTEQNGFLYDFIRTIEQHDVSIEDILVQFRKYSDRVHFEKMAGEEFDYLVYFEDGEPDAYRYCVTEEGCHMIYHRYTKADYEEITNVKSIF